MGRTAEEWESVFARIGMTPAEIRDFHRDWLASIGESMSEARKQALEEAARFLRAEGEKLEARARTENRMMNEDRALICYQLADELTTEPAGKPQPCIMRDCERPQVRGGMCEAHVPAPVGRRCRCTHEAGDSDCPVHPICAHCNVPTNGEELCPRCKAAGKDKP